MIYLDNNATTAIDPRVVDAMTASFLSGPANPSSQHRLGQAARNQLDNALETIGCCIGTPLDQPGGPRLLITSGGTESNNLALFGLRTDPQGPLVISRIEHPSVLAAANSWSTSGFADQGREIRWIESDADGRVRLDNLADIIGSGSRKAALVSIMSANNETGVLQPIDQAAEICRDAGVPMHVDATQTFGKLPVDVGSWGATAVSFTAHKFHGPTGVGGLWLAGGTKIEPILHGGQ